jgi:hypothetical protein
MNFKDLIVELLPEKCDVSLEEVDCLWREKLLLHIVVLNHKSNGSRPPVAIADLEFIDCDQGWFDIVSFPRHIGTFNLHHPETVDELQETLYEECYDCEVKVKYARGP